MISNALFDLQPHGPDTFVGVGPAYPWGGLYGGQVIAQALFAAAATVDPGRVPHSLRAYFIRRGDHSEPVRYEVDRVRDGRSFSTRRVIARQAVGAILNLEASFHTNEPGADVQTTASPQHLPHPDSLGSESWSSTFDRRWVPGLTESSQAEVPAGFVAAWLKLDQPIGSNELLQRCWLAYMSDDVPTEAVARALALGDGRASDDATHRWDGVFAASLDHAMWFHRPVRADEWHLHDVRCTSYQGGRGLTIGNIFALNGTHVATFAQEVLLRDVAGAEIQARERRS